MKIVIIALLSICALFNTADTPPDGWPIFAKVKFTDKYYKEVDAYFATPFFDSRIQYYAGKELTLRGYYMPYELDEKNVIIISRNPTPSCFFCGGSGPESVAEVVLPGKAPRLKADQIVTVSGRLKLNGTDINHLNFILENAAIDHIE